MEAQVVVMTTQGITSDDKIVTMTTLWFQWACHILNVGKWDYGKYSYTQSRGFVSESRELLLLELMLGLELLKLRSLTSPLGKFVI